jgi:ubiquinone/menaquinone biosynthesis C-methylase UbiE
MLDSPQESMLPQFELQRYLGKVESAFGVKELLRLQTDKESIVRYYSESEAGYRVFHNSEGAMHMTLSVNGSPEKDYLAQARMVEESAREISAKAILELGCGKGFNVGYLAGRNSDVRVVGIDLTPKHLSAGKQKYSKLKNLSLEIGDFQALPFEDASFDVVFEVEAVCHAQDAAKAFREAYRVLRPGGRFVIFDGFRAPDLESYSQELQLAVRLVELTMAVRQFPPLEHWLDLGREAGFSVLETKDLSKATMTNLERFQFLARGFYKFPLLTKQLTRMLPSALVKNSVAGLLLPFTVTAGAQRYCSVILEKRGD